MFLLKLYRLLIYLLTPFLKGWIYWRLIRRKEHSERFRERFGKTRLVRPEGDIFWFHGASNGECLSFLSLIKHYQEKHPKAHFLITSHTLTSADLVQSKLPKRAVHQFIPVDHPLFIKRFLNHWKPKVAFWTESELWPNLIQDAQKNTPFILLNGRLSDRSYKNWQKAPGAIREILEKFSIIFCQSKSTLKNFQALGAKEARFEGNLKFSGRPLEANPEKLKELKQDLKGRKLWAASCTHSGEEEIVVGAHQALKKQHKSLLTIVVPRHPHRADKLRQEWEAEGLVVAQRSLQDRLDEKTDLYLFDVTGELGLIYRLVDITLIGGSLVEGIGGHNPLEAANLECAILSGDYTKNNGEIYQIFKDAQACVVVKNSRDLSKVLGHLFENETEKKALIQRSFQIAQNQQGVLENIVHVIDQSEILQ